MYPEELLSQVYALESCVFSRESQTRASRVSKHDSKHRFAIEGRVCRFDGDGSTEFRLSRGTGATFARRHRTPLSHKGGVWPISPRGRLARPQADRSVHRYGPLPALYR